MAPSVTIDNTSDFDMPTAPAPTKSDARTLLLAPPSIAAHPEALTKTVEAHDRSVTDIQMLDRLAMGLVALPASTYDIVLLLTDVDGSRQESSQLLDRTVMERIVAAMKEGGRLKAQDGSFARIPSAEQTEAILAGLTKGDGEGMVKPQSTNAGQTVKLSFGKKKANAAAVPLNGIEAANTAKRKEGDNAAGNGVQATPAGVGFIDNVDDFDANMDYDDDDDEPYIPSNEELQAAEKIDPDTLLTEEDRLRPIIVPEACKPNTKRRRACKDCTCGLAERLNAEDKTKRDNADADLAKLNADDLTEVDFTVQGKVGSCGNCALGDAFRCDGCPYIGLPAFKPGEEVRLVNNDVQL